MEKAILVRYAEIHLKGLNRPFFERLLVDRIQQALNPIHPNVEREQGRIFVYGVCEEQIQECVDRLRRVFGIHSVSVACCVEKVWEKIRDAAIAETRSYAENGEERTFKCFARRSDKRFPMTSEEICRELGHELLQAYPELPVTVEIRQNNAFVYIGEVLGAGGMPVGSNGKAMLLISGGIDSPVAGYMIAKRGVMLDAVHFYSYPYTSERARDKVVELAKLVSRYAGRINLYLVPFTDIQMTIYDKCPSTETTVLMRRLMMKIAERIAKDTGSQALITGESIGQVASQTIESLCVTDDAVSMPVFRPLIGFDKEEIIDKAQKIGTFETSILPYEDCCTVFVPKHPVTKPKVDKLRESESLVDFEPMIRKAIEETDRMQIG